MVPKLIFKTTASQNEVLLDNFPLIIGRSEDASIRLMDRWVSRHHCKIDFISGVLVVHDLDSRHGVYINGEQVEEAPLMPGDELSVGLSTCVADYEMESADTVA